MKGDLQRLVSGRKLETWPSPRPPVARKWMTPVLVALLVVALGLELVTLRWKTSGLPAKGPQVVPVLPFDAVGGNREIQVLFTGFTHLLTTRLTPITTPH